MTRLRDPETPANPHLVVYAAKIAKLVELPTDLGLICAAFGVSPSVLDNVDRTDRVAVLTRAGWDDTDSVTVLMAIRAELRRLRPPPPPEPKKPSKPGLWIGGVALSSMSEDRLRWELDLTETEARRFHRQLHPQQNLGGSPK